MGRFEEVRDVIVNALGCDEDIVTETALIKDDLGADSLAVVELVMALEDEFGLTIGEEQMAEIKTVGDVVTLVGEK